MDCRSELYLTTRELAVRWKMNPSHLDNKRGEGKHDGLFIKIGGAVRYVVAEIEKYERRQLKA